MTETLVNSLMIGFIAAVFAAMLAYIVKIREGQTREIRKSIEHLETTVHQLNVSVATLAAQMAPLWARVQAQISEDLHHPSERYQEMDRLLEALDDGTITAGGRIRLKQLLRERSLDYHPEINDEQRHKAAFMGTVMDMVLDTPSATLVTG